MEGCEVCAVVNQDAALFCAQQESASGQGEHSSELAKRVGLGKDLPGTLLAERQNTSASSGQVEFRLRGVCGATDGHAHQRRSGKLQADSVAGNQLPVRGILGQARGTT